jgi:hypothetical protein
MKIKGTINSHLYSKIANSSFSNSRMGGNAPTKASWHMRIFSNDNATQMKVGALDLQIFPKHYVIYIYIYIYIFFFFFFFFFWFIYLFIKGLLGLLHPSVLGVTLFCMAPSIDSRCPCSHCFGLYILSGLLKHIKSFHPHVNPISHAR